LAQAFIVQATVFTSIAPPAAGPLQAGTVLGADFGWPHSVQMAAPRCP